MIASELLTWCGFAGTWLLVAGPVYQAALELQELNPNRQALTSATTNLPGPEPVSPWWWLLPPIGYWLNVRRANAHRRTVEGSMSAVSPEQFVRFIDKATGWLLVAGGAYLLGLQQTANLCSRLGWSAPVFWILAVAMPLACTLYTAVRTQRTRKVLDRASDA